MTNSIPKTPASAWVHAAREALIRGGPEGVKVDRLARSLHVTRGGFYHHFADRAELLGEVLKVWSETNHFVPVDLQPADPAQALRAVDKLVDHLIAESAFDPMFDMAVRAWARADAAVAARVDRADQNRVLALEAIFKALGCDEPESAIRARVFYFHQIGYYAIGAREGAKARRERVADYLRILCGEENLARARTWAKNQRIDAESASARYAAGGGRH